MTVEQKFTGDTKDIEAAYQRMQKDVLKLRDQLASVKTAAKEAGKAQKDAAEQAADAHTKLESSIASVAGSYLTVSSAIAFVNKGLQDQIDLQDKVAGAQKSAADAQIKFLRNLGNVSAAERASAIAEVGAISNRTGVSQQQIYQMASTAVSARGAATIPQMFKTVESAARIAPEDAAEGTAIAGGMLDAASLTGTYDADRNRALLIQLQQQARSTTMQSVSRHVIPAAISVKSYGATTGEASAAITAMTNAMKDPEGATSGTAMIALAQQAAGETKGGFGEDIAKLRSDPKLRDAFMNRKGVTFERRAESFVKEFLTEGSPTAMLYDQFKRDMPTDEQSARLSQEFEAGILSPDLQRAEGFRKATATKAESRRIGDLRSGDYARVRAGVEDLQQSEGIPWASRAIGGAASRFAAMRGSDPLEAAYYGTEIQRMEMQGRGDLNSSDPTARKTAEQQLAALIAIQKTLSGEFSKRPTNINAHTE